MRLFVRIVKEVTVYYAASVYTKAQQNMRRLLLLLPWMVTTVAAAQDAPRPATLRYTYIGPTCEGSVRVGDELYAPTSTLYKLGWKFTVAGSDLVIEVEAKTFRIPAKVLDRRIFAPIRQTVEQMGGGSEWQKDGKSLDVFSILRSLEARDGKIEFQASLPVKPVLTTLKNPARLSLDLIGARMVATTQCELGSDAKASQYSPGLVRVIAVTDRVPTMKVPPLAMSLTLDWGEPPARPLSFEEFANFLRPIPAFSYDDTVPQSAEPTSDLAQAGPFEIVSELGKSSLLSLRLGRPLLTPARFSRLGPTEIEIVLSGFAYPAAPPFESKHVSEVAAFQNGKDLTLRLTLARPLGVEFSSKGNELQIMLLVPPVGDGKIAGKVIVVDAGHGGNDSGARDPAKTTNEKDLTLSMAKKVSAKLAGQGATVIMTRKTDEFIALRERSEIANRNKADLFVSVHINSNRVANTSSGSIIFYHKKDPIGVLLADCIRSETAKRSKLPSIGIWSDTRIYDTGFAVLRYSKMPAVLVEVGFINNKKDLAAMRDEKFQADFVDGIVEGIRVYFGNGK